MGGMHGMGPIKYDPNEPVFHEPWEGRAWGLRAAGSWLRGRFGTSRYDLERMPPADYLRVSYYERWFSAIRTLLLEKGVLTADELGGEDDDHDHDHDHDHGDVVDVVEVDEVEVDEIEVDEIEVDVEETAEAPVASDAAAGDEKTDAEEAT